MRAPDGAARQIVLESVTKRYEAISGAVLTAALFAVFPIVLMVAAGVRDVDPTLVTVATAMGATRWQIGRKVLLPAVLPSVLAGMRVGMVFAMLGVLPAEMMFAGNRGMGFLMQRLAVAFKAPELFAATAIVPVHTLQRTLRAIFTGHKFCRENPDEAIRIASKGIGWSEAATRRAYELVRPLLSVDGRIDVDALRFMQDTLLELGVLKKRLPLEDHYSTEFTPVRI